MMFKGGDKAEYLLEASAQSTNAHPWDPEVCVCFHPLTSFLLQTVFTLVLNTFISSLAVFMELIVSS